MRKKNLIKKFYIAGVFLFLYLPLIVTIIFSFNSAARSSIWNGFTLKWYSQIITDHDLLTAAGHSLLVSFSAASLATIIGSLAAISLFRYVFFFKPLLYSLLFTLVVSADIIMAIALLSLFNVLNINLGFWTLLIAHITFCIPFVSATVYSRVLTINKNLFEAAQDLGANDWVILKRILIPLLWPAMLAGWLLSFTMSLDDVIISYFVTGPTFDILPLKIYSLVRLGVKPEINALCTILLGVTLALVISSQLLMKNSQEKIV